MGPRKFLSQRKERNIPASSCLTSSIAHRDCRCTSDVKRARVQRKSGAGRCSHLFRGRPVNARLRTPYPEKPERLRVRRCACPLSRKSQPARPRQQAYRADRSPFREGSRDGSRRQPLKRRRYTSGGRTPAQGSLAWIWGKSSSTIPIPGFKNVAQVEQNAKAMEFGPLSAAQMAEIDQLLGRT